MKPQLAGLSLEILAIVVPSIGPHPIGCPSISNALPIPEGLSLNHRCEMGNNEPDLLLNAALTCKVIIGAPQRIEHYSELSLLLTVDGNIFVGTIGTNCNCLRCSGEQYQAVQTTICTKTDTKTLNQNIESILRMEHFKDDGIDNLTASDSEALRKLESSIKFVPGVKDHDEALGSYQVGQIWKTEEPPHFYSNLASCKARWRKAEAQIMSMAPAEKEMVIESIERHIKLGQYKPATPEQIKEFTDPDANCYFLPPRVVLSKSDSTPARYCLDGSAPSGRRGPSVNSAQLKSVCALPDQRVAILRWRQYLIAYLCDISKFFLSIIMQESDRKYQLMLYKHPGSPGEPQIYVCERVIFGLRSSPGISDFVLKYHLNLVANDPNQPPAHRAVAKKVATCLYADNWMSGSDKLEDAIAEVTALNEILMKANMKMCKYGSHSKELLEAIPAELRATSDQVSFGQSSSQENGVGFVMGQDQMDILGMSYSHLNDRFNFGGYSALKEQFDRSKTLTKRQLASAAAKPGFDLIGVRSPFTLMARNLLQQTFNVMKTDTKTGQQVPMGWDDELPEDLDCQFKSWLDLLPGLDDISIPRHIKITPDSTVEIFCDAGTNGICCQAIIRTETKQKHKTNIETFFAYATCKVRSIAQDLSIPRLELQAILTAVRVGQLIQKAYDIESRKINIWSDSMVSLAWVKKSADELSPWHFNRVKVINESGFGLSYIPSEYNSADIGTKDIDPSVLKTSEWLNGPYFLRTPRSEWQDFIKKKDFIANKDPNFLEGIRKGRVQIVFKTETEVERQTFFQKLINTYLKESNSFFTIKRKLALIVLACYHLPMYRPADKRGYTEDQFVDIVKRAKYVLVPKTDSKNGPTYTNYAVTRSQFRKSVRTADSKDFSLNPDDYERHVIDEKLRNLAEKERLNQETREKIASIPAKSRQRHKFAKNPESSIDKKVEREEPKKFLNRSYNKTHAMITAELILFSYSQQKYFKSEIEALKNNRPISKTSSILSLNPQLVYKYGQPLLVARSRLAESLILQRQNCPVILSHSCFITKIYLKHIHETFYHAGRNFLLSYARNYVHVTKAGFLCKQIVQRCITCQKHNAQTYPNLMASLPSARIDIENITEEEKLGGDVGIATGRSICIDYCGPFWTTAHAASRPQTRSQGLPEPGDEDTTGGPKRKVWVAVVVDLLSRFTQAFVVPNLSTESFLQVIICVKAIFGTPRNIYLDNQTSFVAGASQLHEANTIMAKNLDLDAVSRDLPSTNFAFGVPNAPFYQAAAESAVKSLKTALKKTLSTHVLSFHELQVQLFNIVTYLNARPLGIESASSDAQDPDNVGFFTLTPGHLHYGRPLQVPVINFDDSAKTVTERDLWKKRKLIAKELKIQFLTSYIRDLQTRNKWKAEKQQPLKVGDFVLVENTLTEADRHKMNSQSIPTRVGLHFSQWPLARVTRLIPDARDPTINKAAEIQLCNAKYKIVKDENGKDKVVVLRKPSKLVRDVNSLKELRYFNADLREGFFQNRTPEMNGESHPVDPHMIPLDQEVTVNTIRVENISDRGRYMRRATRCYQLKHDTH